MRQPDVAFCPKTFRTKSSVMKSVPDSSNRPQAPVLPLPEVHGVIVDQPGARFAGSQPCLFLGSEPSPLFAQAAMRSDTQPRRKSRGSAPKSSRLKRSESFSVPGTWGVLPPPPPPVPQHREEHQTPSLSPLAVVRNKRASQVLCNHLKSL
jgi:hypothetical protein